jgi:hypothetical protein
MVKMSITYTLYLPLKNAHGQFYNLCDAEQAAMAAMEENVANASLLKRQV